MRPGPYGPTTEVTMRNERSAASPRFRARRVPVMMVIAASTATFAAAVQGAPPTPAPQASAQPPSTQASPPAPPGLPATPGVTNVQSVSNSGPVSGGGDAP